MRVVQVERFGPPEVLAATEVPDLVAGPGQAVIGVSAADILFLETQVRAGLGGDFFPVSPPYVPGDGVAGAVLSVGQGVAPAWVGRPVVAHTGGYGGYAERVVVPAEALLSVPDGLSLPQAAALLNDGPVALTIFAAAGVTPRDAVLVLAAAGGMGNLLVQLAHQSGAQVIGAARGKRKLDQVRRSGADFVVDYSAADWPEQVLAATGGAGADVVLDGAGGAIGRAALTVTARGGRFSAHGAPSGEFAEIDPQAAERLGIAVRGIQDVQLADQERRELAQYILAEAAMGRIRPLIGQTYPLHQAADAHAAIAARTAIGKSVLLV
ncbi:MULTISPECIES: zinc-binding dehydrogenase [unclassified Streptomyces]|uniref:zinc-binding dehydrogenase n=1 Tax=unclassified Streptomyces TaxID=2593676 RepID=UPI0036F06DB8